MKQLRIFLFVLIVLVAVNGCSAGAQKTDVSLAAKTAYPTTNLEGNSYPYPAAVQPYPYPYSAVYQPYPNPESTDQLIATPGPIPSPAADSGVVIGRLLLKGKPLVNKNMYLAEMLKDEQGNDAVASFDRASSPRAFTDAEGHFVFANVNPGRYSLILDVIVSSFLLGYPNGSGPIFLQIEAGKTADVGKLDYSDLSIPE